MTLIRDAYRPACIARRAPQELPFGKCRELHVEVNERRACLFFGLIVYLVGRLTILCLFYRKGDQT
jgi:hypothetical protein